MNEGDLLLFAGAGVAAYYLLYTDGGKSLLNDLGLGEIVEEITGPPSYTNDEVQDWIDKESEYYFPIQDLLVPKGWPNTGKYNYPDPYRTPSKEGWRDWYIKGAYGYPEDQLVVPHYNWNPDYYFYFGNITRNGTHQQWHQTTGRAGRGYTVLSHRLHGISHSSPN